MGKLACALSICVMLGSLVASVRPALAETEPVHPIAPTALPAIPPVGGGTPMFDAASAQQLYQMNLRGYKAELSSYAYQMRAYTMKTWEWRIKTALVGGLLDAMALVTQRLAYQTAQLILTGGNSKEPMFWNQPIGEWLENVANDASSVFLGRLDTQIYEWTKENTGLGFGLCRRPDPLTLKLALSIGKQGMVPPGSCALSQMGDNFEAIADMVESGDAVDIQRPQFVAGPNNDLSATLSINYFKMSDEMRAERDKLYQRFEGQGMKQVTDVISGKIKYPSLAANNSLLEMDPVKMMNRKDEFQKQAMLDAYWETGLEGVAWITLSTFVNTMVVGILERIFKQDAPGGDSINASELQVEWTFNAIKNQDASGDAQDLYERESFAKALGDYIVPNYSSREDRDLIGELMTCVTPRGRWSCSMDQAFAVAIMTGGADGALTVGRASGVGMEKSGGQAGQGLHPDWELVPESDIKNNSDPSCAQRAYCAGNLKKLRLARILPIGWEMAANSPYNIKKNGKYITLSEVIRGYFECNDQGQLDVDHPWCHLIDPNWILAAPKYQCRAKGYGDTLMPNVGTRLEECGDIVSCLSTNQKGECVGGYGYCMAERPVYRFDAQECQSQFASCRTWQSSKGATLSGLRYTVERGSCSEENIGCMWYATDRKVADAKSPDGLWVGTVTSGPRVYLDGTAEPCTSEGCTKMLRVDVGSTALNLVNNGSFEQDVPGATTFQSFVGWNLESNMGCPDGGVPLATEAFEGSRAWGVSGAQYDGCYNTWQYVQVVPNRNYTISFYYKIPVGGTLQNNPIGLSFAKFIPDEEPKLTDPASVATYGDCAWSGTTKQIISTPNLLADGNWQRWTCQFVSPKGADMLHLNLNMNSALSLDDVQLEEGEFSTSFVDGVADLDEAYLKIAPDEYACTGNDAQDNPACKRFARVCRQPDVGCQGYKDIEDPTAPEIPASLSVIDQCPAVCAGYGEYRKLPSSFDLVKDEVNTQFSDPEDDGVAYFVPSLADKCTLSDVGCEAFTSMEAATSTGETIYHFNGLRSCEKPGDESATYFTWEGSDVTGYQLRTWSLMASSTDPNDHGPEIKLKGAVFGSVKDPAACNEVTWKNGSDPDCLQFYDANSAVYYRYYSQTVSSDPACTLMRKNDSSLADCEKTGGEFQAQTRSCMYNVLTGESLSCSANAGGCRAYMGPTGRNAVNVFYETFMDTKSNALVSVVASAMKQPQLSKESVLVGDQSLKLEPSAVGGAINAAINVPVSSTGTLYRISFWAKANSSLQAPSTITIDKTFTATYKPDVKWKRFEVGPFYVKGNVTNVVTPNAQKSCGGFALTHDQAFWSVVKASLPAGATNEQVDAAMPLALAGLWNNPNIAKNAVQFAGKTCSNDSECQNLFIYQANGTDIAGSAQGKCGYKQPIALVEFSSPANTNQLYIDTIRVDQLNDVQFVRKGQWSVPAACDATYPEGVPEPRAMLGCRAYSDRDGNTAFVRNFSSLCSQDAIGCKAFVDTRGRTNPYPESKTFKGTAGPSKHTDKTASSYDEQFLGDWSVATKPYRYYYAIDDARGVCDSGQDMCRAFGQPLFSQDRLALGTGTSTEEADKFKTVLLKDDWSRYTDENGEPKMACRKDELFCDRFQSGNMTEYFRDPGNHSCVWQQAKKLKANPDVGILADGDYSGWFQENSDIPCYPSYLGSGDTYLLNYTAEDAYSGWVGKCPVDQSECTQFVDPNDTSDPSQPEGRSYFMVNSNKLDTRSCGGSVNPLSGCVLFNNKSNANLLASSDATYAKIQDEKGAAVNGVDCDKDSGNPYCVRKCVNFVKDKNAIGGTCPANWDVSAEKSMDEYYKNGGGTCTSDEDCSIKVVDYPNKDCPNGIGRLQGTCSQPNDANVVLKVKLDRECARWMGCRTGETVFDNAEQKFVTRCSDLQLCEKNGSKNEDIFCSRFTDRSKEEFLKPGQFVSLEQYSSRSVGWGKMDYSGFTIPNQYLLSDIVFRPVGYEILTGDIRNSYRYDQRLVAKVSAAQGGDIEIVNDPTFDKLPAGMFLCRDKRTGRYGYAPFGFPANCYLAISEPQALSSVVGGQSNNADLSRDIQRIYQDFARENTTRVNATLQGAMPSPECQLYPEETSPLSNEYVAKWNTKAQPPSPEAMAEGYENAQACMYGEDCSCSYRKVRYQSGTEKFYAIDGQAPMVGVCMGGDKDGQACVPGGYTPVNSQNQVLVNGTLQNPLNSQDSFCTGGMCVSIQDVVVMNGRYGYCLERDKTRASGVAQNSGPCLTWSPQAVIGGQYDASHYSPTAGYLPPQGSGEYYCVSGANEQKVETVNPVTKWWGGDGVSGGDNFWNPGKVSELGFSRPWVWWKSSDGVYASNPEVKSIDGSSNSPTASKEDKLDRIRTVDADGKPLQETVNGVQTDVSQDVIKGSYTKNLRFACRRTSLCEGLDMSPKDEEGDRDYWNRLDGNNVEGKWIMTGDGIVNSYMEYFIPEGNGITDSGRTRESFYDYRYGMFHFSVEPFGAGSACKWNPRWMGMDYPTVDQSSVGAKKDAASATPQSNFSCESYLNQVQQTSQQFYQQFKAAFPGIVDRKSEKVYMNSQEAPIKLKCAIDGSKGSCYYKYWETGFQNQGQEAFVWPERVSPQKLEGFDWKNEFRRYYAHECNAGQPYFAIRAMFQNVNDSDNKLTPDEAKETGFEGPWQFIGFWMTTCLPTKTMYDPGWLYMRLDVVRADVCRQVGQVIAPNTRESAAFADRVWASGKFFLPSLGVNYDSRNEPFGASISTGRIGSDPMLLGASVPTAGALNSQPTFVDSGVGTAAPLSPQDPWVPLTNLFARVYKVYRWEPTAVASGDWTCVKGTNVGRPCYGSDAVDGLKVCGDYAECNSDIDTDLKNRNWRCNTLSGVNRGLHCGDLAYPARNTDEICHNAPMAWKAPSAENAEERLIDLNGKCEKNQNSEIDYKISSKVFGQGTAYPDIGNCGLSPGHDWINYGNMGKYADDKASDYLLKFKAVECGASNPGRYYAAPLMPPDKTYSLPVGADYGYTYSTPIVVLYGILTMAGQDSCSSDQPLSGLNLLSVAAEKVANDPGLLSEYKNVVSNLVDLKNKGTWTCQYNGTSMNYPVNDDAHIKAMLLNLAYNWKSNKDVPNTYQLGAWEGSTLAKLGMYSCAAGTVRAGQLCGNPGEYSQDCPMLIDACAGGVYVEQNYQGEKVPSCGKCVTDSTDPLNASYPHRSDKTGYCKGFNPLARCRTDNDCTFTAYEHWGAFDEGGATGKDWNRKTTNFRLLVSENFMSSGATGYDPNSAEVLQVRLPMPVTGMGVQKGTTSYLPQQYSIPATLTTFNGTDQCVIKPIKVLCDFLYPTQNCAPGDWVCAAQNAATNPGLKNCYSWCKNSALLMPNSYATAFKMFTQRGQQGNGAVKKERLAAVAPFAVNPLIRTLRDMGFAYAKTFEGFGNSSMFFGYAMGQIFDGRIFGMCSMPLCGAPPASLAFPTIVFDAFNLLAANHFYNTGKVEGVAPSSWWALNTRLANNDYWDPAKNGNDTFPWDPMSLRFTTIFPLAVSNNYGDPVLLANSALGSNVATGWHQAQKIWSGYGMSSDLIASFDAWLGELKANPSQGDKETALRLAYERQYLTDMQTNFYDKTGWGSFRDPEDPDLALYPGAMPAAKPSTNNAITDGSQKKMLNVFVPGHCEPPQGGTDTDSVDGDLKNVMSFDRDTIMHAGTPQDTGDGAFRIYQQPYESYESAYEIESTDTAKYLDANGYKEAANAIEEHEWVRAYVEPKQGSDSQNIELEGPVGVASANRTTCRCEGGKLDGTVQESKEDCNQDLWRYMNPDLMDANRKSQPSEFCKQNAWMDQTGTWIPIDECKIGTGKPNNPDPNADDNMCTHRAGYVPRGDVCADGRDNCLISYDVSNPLSTNHRTKKVNDAVAPSATDVTSGLDAYSYLTGGKVTRLNKEYTSWYRPLPPRVAAPDASKSTESANAQPIVHMDSFSVDNRPEGMTFFGGGQGLATVRFYAWAAHNQGPVQSVVIDWGDGTVQTIENTQMKNQKPICNTESECEFMPGLACNSDADCPPAAGACLPTGTCKKQSYKDCHKDSDCGTQDVCEPRMMFGNSSEACKQGYFEFSHVYRCDATTSLFGCSGKSCENEPNISCLSSADCRPQEQCVDGLAPNKGCYNKSLDRCRYTPRVMVTDNWGWCTGDCSMQNEASPGGPQVTNKMFTVRHPNGGCWDGSQTKLNLDTLFLQQKQGALDNECIAFPVTKGYRRPWIIYDGSVEVGAEGEVEMLTPG